MLKLQTNPDWNWMHLGHVSPALLDPIIEKCQNVHWGDKAYNRYEPKLLDGRRMLEFPFILKMKRVDSEQDKELMRSAAPFFETFKILFSEYLWVRAELGVLEPGVVIGWHIDENYTATNGKTNWHPLCSKLHIPLITNSDCSFLWDDETMHMPVGNIYNFNNLKRHSARNDGSTTRIHLIVTIIHKSMWGDLVKELSPYVDISAQLKFGQEFIV